MLNYLLFEICTSKANNHKSDLFHRRLHQLEARQPISRRKLDQPKARRQFSTNYSIIIPAECMGNDFIAIARKQKRTEEEIHWIGNHRRYEVEGNIIQ